MPNEEHACLTRAWQMICQLICLLQVHVPRLSATSETRWTWLHLTRVAESLVRRWLILKACQLEVWPTARKPTPPQRPAKAGGQGSKATKEPKGRRLQFRLVEPEARLPVFVLQPANGTEPACYILQHDGPNGVSASPRIPSAFNPKSLQRRCAVLSAVMADPDVYTLRMARWLSRAAANRLSGPGRRHPTRPHGPPGASRRQRRRDPERQDMLYWIDHLAHEAVMRRTQPPPQTPAQAGVHGPMVADESKRAIRS